MYWENSHRLDCLGQSRMRIILPKCSCIQANFPSYGTAEWYILYSLLHLTGQAHWTEVFSLFLLSSFWHFAPSQLIMPIHPKTEKWSLLPSIRDSAWLFTLTSMWPVSHLLWRFMEKSISETFIILKLSEHSLPIPHLAPQADRKF